MKRTSYFSIVILFLLSLSVTSCGGGGSSTTSTDEESVGTTRTTGTGLRIIHGSVDATPITLKIGEDEIQSASYADVKGYRSIPQGELLLSVQRQNAPTSIVANTPLLAGESSEYTLFVSGSVSDGNFSTRVLTDVVSQPDSGRALVQILNSYQGNASISVSADGDSFGTVAHRGTSGFVETNSGIRNFVVKNPSGATIARVSVDVADRGEITILVTGSVSLGVIFVKVYPDLD